MKSITLAIIEPYLSLGLASCSENILGRKPPRIRMANKITETVLRMTASHDSISYKGLKELLFQD
jgi:hypothetical protein